MKEHCDVSRETDRLPAAPGLWEAGDPLTISVSRRCIRELGWAMQFETCALLQDVHSGRVLLKSEVSQADYHHRNVTLSVERGNML